MDRTLRNRFCVAGVAALALVVYANALRNGFAYDDVPIVQTNARVHGLGYPGDILLTPYWPFLGQAFGLYRPLTILAYAVQWAVGGGAAWVFHLGNLVEHAAVSVLVFLLLERLTSWRGALAGALIFAVHPVHTEAVANIVGQAELLGAIGVLTACLLYAARPALGLAPGRRWAIAAAYLFAVATKESTIVLPALLPVLDLAQRRLSLRRDDVVRYARALAPTALVLGVIGCGYVVLRFAILGSLTASDPNPSLRFLHEHHFLMGLRVWPEYVRLLLFPSDLSADYSPMVIAPITSMTLEAAIGLGLLGLTVLCALVLPRHPGVGLPAAWFLVSILIVSNLFFPIGIVLAERTLYLPSVALAAAVAYAWDWGWAHERRPRPALAWGALAVLLLLGGMRVWRRNPDWHDTKTLFFSIVRDHPESFRAQWFAGDSEENGGKHAAARDHWTLAYRLWPEGGPGFWDSMAGFLYRSHRYDEAARMLEHSIANFRMGAAPLGDYELLTLAYLGGGRFEPALRTSERAMRVHGPRPGLVDLRAHALTALGRPEAITAWHSAIRADSAGGQSEQWTELARSLAGAGRIVEARAALDTARLRAGTDREALQRVAAYERWFIAGDTAVGAPPGHDSH